MKGRHLSAVVLLMENSNSSYRPNGGRIDPVHQALMTLLERAGGKEEGILARQWPLFLQHRECLQRSDISILKEAYLMFSSIVLGGIVVWVLWRFRHFSVGQAVFVGVGSLVPGLYGALRVYLNIRQAKKLCTQISEWPTLSLFEDIAEVFDLLYPMGPLELEDECPPGAIKKVIVSELGTLRAIQRIQNLNDSDQNRLADLQYLATHLGIEVVSADERIRRENAASDSGPRSG